MTTGKRIRKHYQGKDGKPKCGRQLSRPALTTANQDSMQLTEDRAEVGCRHCLRALGLLAPVRLVPALTEEEIGESEGE